VLCTIEKRGITTFEAVRRLSAALRAREADCGTAGLKDKVSVSRQQVSLPAPATPEAALAVSVEGVRVLSAARHGNKLKTGHLRGNRFLLVIRGLAVPPVEAARRAELVLARLETPPGVPAWYGEQRFGVDRRNVELGRRYLAGERVPLPPRERRLIVNAVQSELFNAWLAARLADGLYAKVIDGDLLRRTDSGAVFVTTHPDLDQPRLDRGEVAPTGPMFGPSMRTPPEGSEAARREAAVLEAAGLSIGDFARAGKLAEGTRRPAAFSLHGAMVRPLDEDAIELRFSLPPGGYATVVASEVMKDGS
jgi:tRNA pseudouridine13 synthase